MQLTDLVCPGGRCLDDEGIAPTRADGLHFSEATAISAAQWLLDRLAPLLDRHAPRAEAVRPGVA